MPCPIFTYYDQFIGNKEKYIMILSKEFFSDKLRIEPAVSISSYTTPKCPESRKYELEIWDGNKEQLLHGFIYQKGKVIKTIGNIDKIISIWKER